MEKAAKKNIMPPTKGQDEVPGQKIWDHCNIFAFGSVVEFNGQLSGLYLSCVFVRLIGKQKARGFVFVVVSKQKPHFVSSTHVKHRSYEPQVELNPRACESIVLETRGESR